MVMATSAEGSIAGLDRAIAAGIPVMTVLDSAVGSGEKYTYVGSDFEDWGQYPVEEMARRLNGKGNIVYIKGGAGFLVERNRDKAFKAAIAKHPDIKVIYEQNGNWNKPSGVTIMEDALSRLPDPNSLQGVIAHNDNMALGAVEALKRANRLRGVVVGGSDGNADALQSLLAGELAYTTFQDGETIGSKAIETALEILAEQEPAEASGCSVGPHRRQRYRGEVSEERLRDQSVRLDRKQGRAEDMSFGPPLFLPDHQEPPHDQPDARHRPHRRRLHGEGP